MRNQLFVIMLLLISVIFFTNTCSINKGANVTSSGGNLSGQVGTTQPVNDSGNISNSKEDKTIETVLYKLSIPYYMEADKQLGDSLIFKKDNRNIGGLSLMLYYPGQPLSTVRPNHSTVLFSKKLPDFSYEVWQENLELTQPAASNDKTSLKQTHIYFVFGEQKLVCDLFFNIEDIEDETILHIARSFEVQPPNKNSK